MDKLKDTVRVLKAVSDENRLRILLLLKVKKDLCVCEITKIIGLSQPTISSHLKILENANLIISSRDGKWINYRLNNDMDNPTSRIINQISSAAKDSSQIKSDKKKLEKANRFIILKINK